MSRSGFTLIEVLVGGFVAVLALTLGWDLLTGSGRIIKRSSRVAAGQVALQSLIETINTDVEQLEAFLDDKSLEGAGSFSLVIHSDRHEAGLPPAVHPMFRKVTYTVSASAKDTMKISRQVVNLGPTGALKDVKGTSQSHTFADHIRKIKLVPFVWGPIEGKGYQLAPATAPISRQPGAKAACLSVNVAIAEPDPSQTSAQGGELALTTRLWSRGQLLQLPREGRP